jgi:hypothetical protein
VPEESIGGDNEKSLVLLWGASAVMNQVSHTDLKSLQPDTLSESMIRSIFRDWDSLAALGNHPVASLRIVENCRHEAGYSSSPTGYGLALRKVIQDALETIKPDDSLPRLDDKNWRRFTILQEQYIHTRSPEWIALQLNISKATYYTEQKRALQVLADTLRKWEEEQSNQTTSIPASTQKKPDSPFFVPAGSNPYLIGRNELLSDLVHRLRQDFIDPSFALVGLPGVGKTALALELVHLPEIQEYFQDGILWASLGRQPDLAALLGNWSAAVGSLLEASSSKTLYGQNVSPNNTSDHLRLGMAYADDPHTPPTDQDPALLLPGNIFTGQRSPYGTYSIQSNVSANSGNYIVGRYSDIIAERAMAIHTAIGLRRMLLIVDDAWQSEAALVFKVGGPNCVYLLTTRLIQPALDFAGDQVVRIPELGDADGLDILNHIAPTAVEANPEVAHSLVRLAGGLPLTLTLMGKHLQKQSFTLQLRRLQNAMMELQSAHARMDLTQPIPVLEQRTDFPPDIPLTLQNLIGISETTIDYPAHRTLMALALFPPKPNSFSEEAALAVSKAPLKVLDSLVDSGLLESVSTDRYTLHRSISDYASINGSEPESIRRMVDYYVRFSLNHSSDFAALDLELNNIFTAADLAYNENMSAPLVHLSDALFPLLESRRDYKGMANILAQTNYAASVNSDYMGQAASLCRLGEIAIKQGESIRARSYFDQAITIAHSADLRELENNALTQIEFLSER